MKQAREIKKFHVVALGVTMAKKCTKLHDACAKLLFGIINILFFALLLAVTVVVAFVVIQK